MNINAKLLESLNACEDGYKEFVKNNPNLDIPFKEGLLLDTIPYEHKIWCATIVVDKDILDTWLTDCIEYIVFSYPESYLNGPKIKGTLPTILGLLESDNIDKRIQGLLAAEAFKDIVCMDYPEQKDINLHLLVQLL